MVGIRDEDVGDAAEYDHGPDGDGCAVIVVDGHQLRADEHEIERLVHRGEEGPLHGEDERRVGGAVGLLQRREREGQRAVLALLER